jgi:predicted Zn-dependent protease
MTHLEDGLAHLGAGRWERAVEALRAANRCEPGRLAVVRALVTACLKAGRVGEARATLGSYTSDQPMCAEGWRLAAQLEWKLCSYDEAMDVLARGLARLPNSQILHRQTALFWGARGRIENAQARVVRCAESEAMAARETSAAQPDRLDRLVQDCRLLGCLLDLPSVDEDREMLGALEAKLAKLVVDQPHHADRHFVLARLQMKLDALPAALLSVQRALRVNPRYVEAHRLHATVLGKLDQPDAAIQILRGLVQQGIAWPDIDEQIDELMNSRTASFERGQRSDRRAA